MLVPEDAKNRLPPKAPSAPKAEAPQIRKFFLLMFINPILSSHYHLSHRRDRFLFLSFCGFFNDIMFC
jgi:hypothetical protein